MQKKLWPGQSREPASTPKPNASTAVAPSDAFTRRLFPDQVVAQSPMPAAAPATASTSTEPKPVAATEPPKEPAEPPRSGARRCPTCNNTFFDSARCPTCHPVAVDDAGKSRDDDEKVPEASAISAAQPPERKDAADEDTQRTPAIKRDHHGKPPHKR